MVRNFYASSLLKCLNVDGTIDDFSEEEFFFGKRIYKAEWVDKDSLIVVASGGCNNESSGKTWKCGV